MEVKRGFKMDTQSPEVIIIGSGIGGSMTARRLTEHGINVTIVERGDWLPREDDNWDVQKVFFDKKYTAHESWLDSSGQNFRPSIYYNVGGCTKFYGASLIRYRKEDFEELVHEAGVSPAWPYKYDEIEPYYSEVEKIFNVHGDDTGDCTAPWRSCAYPEAAIPHEPVIEELAKRFKDNGVSSYSLQAGIHLGNGGNCIRCKTCDGFPCKIAAKSDAETALLNPAIKTGRVNLLTNTKANRLIVSEDGKKIVGVEVEQAGKITILTARLIILSCGAINSSALLLKSACKEAPNGVSNSSDLVGRNYMAHVQTALMGISLRPNYTVFQKTLAVNHFYFGSEDYKYPLGHVQMLGKLQAGMLSANVPFVPKFVNEYLANHSVDWIAFTEDLPDPNNRVLLKDGQIQLSVKQNNVYSHSILVKKFAKLLRDSGYPFVLTKALVKHSTGHQCGTAKFGHDPKTSVLDQFCRSHDHNNLFVIDASFMPSSAAVNPVLTIAAQALRAADHILKTEFSLNVSVNNRNVDIKSIPVAM